MIAVVVFLAFIGSNVHVSFSQPCCKPQKWQAVQETRELHFKNGSSTPQIFKSIQTVYVDATKEIITIDGTLWTNGSTFQQFSVQDYKANISYNIIGGTCIKEKITEFGFPDNCVPANSTLVSNGYIGVGSCKKFVRYYDYSIHGLSVTLGVDDECTSIDSEYHGFYKDSKIIIFNFDAPDMLFEDYITAFVHFLNSTTRIQNESVFNVPDICKQSGNKHTYIEDPVGKRSVIFDLFSGI